MKPDKKTLLQQFMNTTVVLDFDDLRTVMHEILEEYIELQKKETEEYLTTAEVKQILHVSQKTLQDYRKKRLIPFIQRGRKIYVKRSDLDAFQEANRIGSRYER